MALEGRTGVDLYFRITDPVLKVSSASYYAALGDAGLMARRAIAAGIGELGIGDRLSLVAVLGATEQVGS